jgi:hypothetical protein
LFEPKLLPVLLFGMGPLPVLPLGTLPLPELLFEPKLLPELLFGAGPLPAELFGTAPLPVLPLGTAPLPVLLFGTLPLPELLFGTAPLPVLPLGTLPLPELLFEPKLLPELLFEPVPLPAGLDTGPLLPELVGPAACPPPGWLAAGAGALLAGGVEFVCLSFCAYTMPDEANSTATSAVPRPLDRPAFKTRRALIESLLVLTRAVMQAVKTGSLGRWLRVTEYIPRDTLCHKGSRGPQTLDWFCRLSYWIAQNADGYAAKPPTSVRAIAWR